MTKSRLSINARLLAIFISVAIYFIHGQTSAQNPVPVLENIAWNFNGTKLAAGYNTGLVQIVDNSNQQVLKTYQVSQANVDLEWSPTDANLLAISGGDGNSITFNLQVINVSNDQLIMNISGSDDEGDTIAAIAWSPDGTKLAGVTDFVADTISYRRVKVWDVVTAQVVKSFPYKSDSITSIDLSPNGNQIATGAIDKSITIWDANTGNVVNTISGNFGTVYSIAYSFDGTKLASGGGGPDKVIHIWNTSNWQETIALSGYSAYEIAWSPDGSRIAAAGSSNVLPVWQVSSGQILTTISSNEPITAVAWSPNGNQLAYGGAGTTVQVIAALATPTRTPTPTATRTPTPTATPGAAQTLTLQINNGADDVNELNTTLSATDATVWVGSGGSTTTSYMGLRFNGVSIPPGATITAARLEFYSTQSQWQDIGAQIRAQAADNAAAFSSGSLPSSRTTGTQMVTHASNVSWSANTWYTFQDGLAPVIQEVISRAGWLSGSSLALILKGSSPGQWGRKFIRSYEGSTTQAARLVISYTSSGAPPPTATATYTFTPAPFPVTGILDNFNRANNTSIGSSWSANAQGYTIASNQLDVGVGGPTVWSPTSFGANQEVYITLSAIDAASSEIDLLLKSQQSTSVNGGVIEVWYTPSANKIQVWTYTPGAAAWVQRGTDISGVTFAAGDRFGARARANGMVEVYKNGTLLGSRDVSAWPYYANGGYLGLWFIGSSGSLLDDFGGGTLP